MWYRKRRSNAKMKLSEQDGLLMREMRGTFHMPLIGCWTLVSARALRIYLTALGTVGPVLGWTTQVRAQTTATCPTVSTLQTASGAISAAQAAKLIELTSHLRTAKNPVLSFLISQDGKLIYEYRAGGVKPDDAHYLMSVTKSIVATLAGIAVGRGEIKGIDMPLRDLVTASRLTTVEMQENARVLTLRNALDMSALNAPLSPHQKTEEATRRGREFWQSSDRFAFAMSQKRLMEPGRDFFYSDITTAITGGVIQNATGQTLLRYANDKLFKPLGFRNADWMHQDGKGQEMAGYGLRLRPIDMQKYGNLFLNAGCWNGVQIVPRSWVRDSLAPTKRSRPNVSEPDYGLGWWAYRLGGQRVHEANGWKGQRISLLPSLNAVITMTAVIEDGTETAFYVNALQSFVVPVLAIGVPRANQAVDRSKLDAALDDVAKGKSPLPASIERRMIPGQDAKEIRRPFSR